MKTTLLLCSAFLATATLTALPSCEKKAEQPAEQPAAAETPQQPEQQPATPPTEAEVNALLTGELGESTAVTPWAVTIDTCTANPDGSFSLATSLVLTVKEELFTREDAPASLNSERMASNESINRAMLPEAVYLMQVGAPTDMLTDADRAASPLPEELKHQANELKEFAEAPLYRPLAPAGQELKLTATFKATPKAEGGWDFSELEMDQSALAPLEAALTRSAMPENAPIATADAEENRKAELRDKIAAFNAAAEPYIKGREDAARTRLAEHRARQDEELKRAAEQAEAEARIRQEWEERCARYIAENKLFSGEWTRDNRFGELTLRITRTTRHNNSIHFIGTIYDTKLPAANLDIAGRCDLSQAGDKAQVDINIYDGQYEPDQPTAEVYDSDDSLMVLKLSADGKLEGIMSCLSWKDTPEKAFNIVLSAVKEKAKARK